MNINRGNAPVPTTADLAGELAGELAKLHGPCLGCKDCKGACRDLFDLLILPGLILAKGRIHDQAA